MALGINRRALKDEALTVQCIMLYGINYGRLGLMYYSERRRYGYSLMKGTVQYWR